MIILGQIRYLEIVWETAEEWKMRAVYICFFIFQCTSCYFVLLIVILRMRVVKNPIGFTTFHKKITKISCILIWMFVIILNVVVTICLQRNVSGSDKYLRNSLIYLRCHLGVTFPVLAAISVNVYLSISLKKAQTPVNDLAPSEQKHKKSLQKLINGLVIWMIICNAPFVAWLHFQLQGLELGKDISLDATSWVWC